MDAVEDRDAALQRSSSELLVQFKLSLPKFLWHRNPLCSSKVSLGLRLKSTVRLSALDNLTKLLEPFQEWPQLLDPELSAMLEPIINALKTLLSDYFRKYYSRPSHLASSTIALPRAICKLLYTFCKIRGSKVICRFLPSEPMYMELVLNAIQEWCQLPILESKVLKLDRATVTWEEKYIMLLWLSHLSLTPFDLVSVSSVRPGQSELLPLRLALPPGIPLISKRSLAFAFRYIEAAGKEREAAVGLLVRLTMRPDMVRLGLLKTLVEWATSSLEEIIESPSTSSIYKYISILSFLASTIKSSDTLSMEPLLLSVFQSLKRIEAAQTAASKFILSSAIARKFIVKVLRSIAVVALRVDSMHSVEVLRMLDVVLEDVIQHLLTALADKDTPVRLAASKALSIVTLNLQPYMASQIIEAVVETMEEKVLWASIDNYRRNLTSDVPEFGRAYQQPDLSAVNSLQWHGLVLTLSHLLFRRCPLAEQIPVVLNALILALGFEQRSTFGNSTGTIVRDAACFGIWSLARRYSTTELLAIDATKLRASREITKTESAIQVVADELVIAATTDPSGNIRRGASAALQELIGRHPDCVIAGIDLVQDIDYHAVALRSTSLREVVIATAKLDIHYWATVVDALFSWRATLSTDTISRRYASRALGQLSISNGQQGFHLTVCTIMNDLKAIESGEVEGRHGLFLAAASVALHGRQFLIDDGLLASSTISDFWKIAQSETTIKNKELTTPVLRSSLLAEGTCELIRSLALVSCSQGFPTAQSPSSAAVIRCVQLLLLSLSHNEEIVIRCASEAMNVLFMMMEDSQRQALLHQWTHRLDMKRSGSSHDNVVGTLAVLGSVYPRMHNDELLQPKILDLILSLLEGETDIETKVGCLKSLGAGALSSRVLNIRAENAILKCLQDYTVDERGDVGSLVRFEAIAAVHTAHECGVLNSAERKQDIIARVCGLAAEKLDKIRFRAWQCLQEIWCITGEAKLSLTYISGVDHCQETQIITCVNRIIDVGQVSSASYYQALMALFSVPWTRIQLLEGIITSAGVGSESVLCASRAAMVTAIELFNTDGLVILWDCLADILKRSVEKERLILPLLEVLRFLSSVRVWETVDDDLLNTRNVFYLTQKCHYKSGNIQRLKAAVDVYLSLVEYKAVRKEVLLKVASMLLHPSSIVRNKAADALYISTETPMLAAIDWSRPPGELKANVYQIRGHLKSIEAD
ncbi:hypothetical protein MMC13_006287 [Lambiella insularis]|nr:hypothetical protein [Lambiella insularis]